MFHHVYRPAVHFGDQQKAPGQRRELTRKSFLESVRRLLGSFMLF